MRVLRIVLDPASLDDLELDDAEIEVTLALSDAAIAELRSGLRRVLGMGMPRASSGSEPIG